MDGKSMSSLVKLKEWLEGAERIALLGIGNELRGDDAIGPLFAKRFRRFEGGKILVLNCGSVPENFSSKIISFKPTHLIVVDAVDMSKPPGSIGVFDESSLPYSSISTHKMTLLHLLDYLRSLNVCPKLILLGIQPKDLSLMAPVSKEAKKALGFVLNYLEKSLSPILRGKTL
jgi:hydrogenase 3 maturation protease